MIDVYLSYHRSDRELAAQLAKPLGGLGFSVWLDNDILPGQSWDNKIQQAIDEAKLVIVLWSHSSVDSTFVREEASAATRLGTYFPVVIDDCHLPIGFSQYLTYVLKSRSPEAISELVRRAIDAIHRHSQGADGLAEESIIESASERPTGLESISSDLPNEEVGRRVRYSNAEYQRPKRAKDTTIFIAHASADKPKLKPVIELLLDNRFQVWVDKPQNIGLSSKHAQMLARSRIKFEGDWKEQINKAARKATRILACWSQDAIQGRREQFHYEIYMGLVSEKLAQCKIDDVTEREVGFPYNFGQIADLSRFDRLQYHFEFQWLMDDLCAKRKARFTPTFA